MADKPGFGLSHKSFFSWLSIKSFPRQSDRPGGGTGILFHESFVALIVGGKEHDSFEFSDWILKASNR